MRVQIFNVEHGACALITDDSNRRIMVDCGHNTTTGWKPGTYLNSIGVTSLDELVITNYDEDHVSGIIDLFDNVFVSVIRRNTAVSPAEIKRLKTEDGMGPGIDRLISELNSKFGPPGVHTNDHFSQFVGITSQSYYHTCADFDDENNLSLVVKFNLLGTSIMFTGDMEKAGWKKMLTRPDFVSALPNTDIFIASHHGRSNGYCEEMFAHFSPTFVVVSDKSMSHASQETGHLYAQRARGGKFNGEDRKFITTRADGDLVIVPDSKGTYWFGKP